MRRRGAFTLAMVLAACSTRGPASPSTPAARARSAEAPAVREPPPASGAAKDAPFPATVRAALSNGLQLAVVPSHALPIVHLRLLVRAGRGWAGPAVTELTASLLEDGGTRTMPAAEVLRKIETLGADLTVHTDFDGTVVGLAVTKDLLPEALRLLAQVVREPRFDAEELKKLKRRASDEAASRTRAGGSSAAMRVVLDRLFDAGGPRASTAPLPSEIAKVEVGALREFHKRFYVPRNAALVVAGDVDEQQVRALAESHFGSWTGPAPERPVFPAPSAPRGNQVVVLHRPRSVQSDVLIATLAPPRKDERWPALRVVNQVLGGGGAGRLLADVREARSLAYRTDARILELDGGAQPLVLCAGTESSKTARAVEALLENVSRMQSAPPTADEVERAGRYLADDLAFRQERLGAVADLVVLQETLGLGDGDWDRYRAALRRVSPSEAAEAAKILYKGPSVVVVAGDADAIASDLTAFGEVTVVDPTRDFQTLRTLPKAKP